MKRNKTQILSLKRNDFRKELEFEVAFQLSLSIEERYKRMKKPHMKTMDFVKKKI